MVIASGRMLGETALLSADSGRVQLMAGDLLHLGAVDDQFLLSDAYRQQFTNALPRHGVEVLQVSGPRGPASPPCPPAHGNRGGEGSQLPATKAAGLQRPPFCSSPSMRSALLTMSRH